MRTRRLVLLAALVAGGLTGAPSAAHAAPTPPKPLTIADLPRLTAELTAITKQAQQLSDDLDAASARDGGLEQAYQQLSQAQYEAQTALGARARAVYMAAELPTFGQGLLDLGTPDTSYLAQRAAAQTLTVDQTLIDNVTQETQAVAHLQARADAVRRSLLRKGQAVLVQEEQARDLLDQAQALAVAAHNAQVQAELAAQRTALDDIADTVAITLTPAQSERARQALADQEPVVQLLEDANGAIPAGYAPTGDVFTGTASWYGPGFDGHPTASGAPYDEERLTCANKDLPLGTVIHVSANGQSTNCLVNDRGPYVGDRILDMSRAGAAALGYSGLAQVSIEVLAPTSVRS